jgi:hypothetical protein
MKMTRRLDRSLNNSTLEFSEDEVADHEIEN